MKTNNTKPIVLSTNDVVAILSCGKITIRRPVSRLSEFPRGIEGETYTPEILDDWTWCWKVDQYRNTHDGHAIPPCFPGDVLYVKESWSTESNSTGTTFAYKAGGIKYVPGYTCSKTRCKVWNPPVTMPKEATRLLVRVGSISMEKAQDKSASNNWIWVITLDLMQTQKSV